MTSAPAGRTRFHPGRPLDAVASPGLARPRFGHGHPDCHSSGPPMIRRPHDKHKQIESSLRSGPIGPRPLAAPPGLPGRTGSGPPGSVMARMLSTEKTRK
jgi:hypothetical protein